MAIREQTMTKEFKIAIPTGYEIDPQASTFEKIVFRAVQDPTWEGLGDISGYYVSNHSIIRGTLNQSPAEDNRNIWATKAQAEASVAGAMLSQLLARANGNWKPDWTSRDNKYTIVVYQDNVTAAESVHYARFLAFRTPIERLDFMETHMELLEKALL